MDAGWLVGRGMDGGRMDGNVTEKMYGIYSTFVGELVLLDNSYINY
jgi:hypothetical protein